MAKEQLTEFLVENLKAIKELFLFIFIVTMGAITKIIGEIRSGTKLTFAYLVAELIMSFFVALIVYGFFDQFLQVNKLFSYTMCAWSGTFSGTFQDKGKELLVSIFDGLKLWIKKRLT